MTWLFGRHSWMSDWNRGCILFCHFEGTLVNQNLLESPNVFVASNGRWKRTSLPPKYRYTSPPFNYGTWRWTVKGSIRSSVIGQSLASHDNSVLAIGPFLHGDSQKLQPCVLNRKYAEPWKFWWRWFTREDQIKQMEETNEFTTK